ncbi:MAG: phosphohydrolase, partial [Desulfatitalea sp.]|nr:phosphohydrolase [Desulfatitalea sp.]
MKCPGQDTQFWNASAIFEATCPQCGRTVEFFKDDTTRKCGGCGHRFVNPKMDFGCAAYCQFAAQCLGDLPPELVAQKEDLLKDRVAIAVKRHLKSDFKRIGRAARRARHAEQLLGAEKGRLAPVIIAAYVWDLDPADPSDAQRPAARALLAGLQAPPPLVDKVCAILDGQGPRDADIANDHQLVSDAAAMAEWEERGKQADGESMVLP